MQQRDLMYCCTHHYTFAHPMPKSEVQDGQAYKHIHLSMSCLIPYFLFSKGNYQSPHIGNKDIDGRNTARGSRLEKFGGVQ